MRLIADHSLVHSTFELLPVLALIVVALGYLVGSWRRGARDAFKETVDLQAAEIATMRDLNARLTADAHACKDAISKLEGVVEQLRQENSELRALVMLEKVPPALVETLNRTTEVVMADVSTMHAAQVAELREAFAELLHPVAQGIDRLLTAERG